MPYGTYEKDEKHAYHNAKKIIQLTGADAVKLEGGEKIFQIVKFLTKKKLMLWVTLVCFLNQPKESI